MTTREWLEQNMANHPDQNALIAACIAAVGGTRDNVTRHLKRIRDDAAESVRNAVTPAGPTSAAAPGVDGFKRLHDPDTTIPEKIRSVINGTVMGYSEFALRCGCDFEKPQQSFVLLHPDRWLTAYMPIYVR